MEKHYALNVDKILYGVYCDIIGAKRILYFICAFTHLLIVVSCKIKNKAH